MTDRERKAKQELTGFLSRHSNDDYVIAIAECFQDDDICCEDSNSRILDTVCIDESAICEYGEHLTERVFRSKFTDEELVGYLGAEAVKNLKWEPTLVLCGCKWKN